MYFPIALYALIKNIIVWPFEPGKSKLWAQSFLMGISMGQWPDFEYHGGKWLKYDWSGFNSSHPSLGSPLNLGDPWRPLATIGDSWRPLATIGDMPENGHFGHFQAFSGMSPMVAKGRQGSPRFKGDPRVGWDELEPNRSYLSHFPTWYSKSGHFPIEIPIKNEKWPPTPSYGSIILKIVLWAHFTITHAVLRGSSD